MHCRMNTPPLHQPCWHPHQTAISQRYLGFVPADRDAFAASLRIMSGFTEAREGITAATS